MTTMKGVGSTDGMFLIGSQLGDRVPQHLGLLRDEGRGRRGSHVDAAGLAPLCGAPAGRGRCGESGAERAHMRTFKRWTPDKRSGMFLRLSVTIEIRKGRRNRKDITTPFRPQFIDISAAEGSPVG